MSEPKEGCIYILCLPKDYPAEAAAEEYNESTVEYVGDWDKTYGWVKLFDSRITLFKKEWLKTASEYYDRCNHIWNKKFLLTSFYEVCEKCGEERG